MGDEFYAGGEGWARFVQPAMHGGGGVQDIAAAFVDEGELHRRFAVKKDFPRVFLLTAADVGDVAQPQDVVVAAANDTQSGKIRDGVAARGGTQQAGVAGAADFAGGDIDILGGELSPDGGGREFKFGEAFCF